MPSAIILHGTCDREEYFDPNSPNLSNAHWFPWLQKELLIAGIMAHTPEIPAAYAPDYTIWKREFTRYDFDQHSILIGHSCGGGFLLRFLSENPTKVGRVILVAPWLDPDRVKTGHFFDFTIDPQITKRTDLHLLHSDNDAMDVQQSVATIRAALPQLTYHEFHNYGHFCAGEMGTLAFPELRDIALKAI